MQQTHTNDYQAQIPVAFKDSDQQRPQTKPARVLKSQNSMSKSPLINTTFQQSKNVSCKNN